MHNKWRSPVFVLILLYLAAVFVHIACLKKESAFPLLITDEVQYVSVGENLRVGNGFTTRGEFHAGIPPLYPIFVAFAHSIGRNMRESALILSCFSICFALFPAYGLARRAGLSRPVSYLLAGAAAMLPNTLWAGLYMTETLNYPLFLIAFYFLSEWVETPTRSRAILCGLLLSAMLLTKVAAWSFALAILVTFLIVHFRLKIRMHAPWLFGIAIGSQLAWQAFKYAHMAAGFGMYGREINDKGLPYFSVAILGTYAADVLFSPGWILAVPLFAWFRENISKRFALCTLIGSTLLALAAVHGTLETGLTGALKERLILYTFPIVSIFGTAGLKFVKKSIPLRIAFAVVPLLLLGAIVLGFSFPYNPVLDVPWASAMGAWAGDSVYHFSKHNLVLHSFLLVAAVSLLFAFIPVKRMTLAASAFLLALNCTLFANNSVELTELSLHGRYPAFDTVGWLYTTPLRPNDRLVVGANMGYYQEAYRTTPFDRFFVDWEVRGGLDDYRVFEIETLGHYDVRVANRPDRIAPLLRPGDFLLVSTRMSGMDLAGSLAPLYLYRMPRTGGDPKVLYEIDVRPELLGAPFSLLPGKYTATLTLKSAPPDKVEFQILTNDAAPLKTDVKTRETTVDFTVSNGPVQFILNSRLGITSFWQGLTIQHH